MLHSQHNCFSCIHIFLLEPVAQTRAQSALAAPRLNTTAPLYLQLHQQKLSRGRKEREGPAQSKGARKGLGLLQDRDEAPLKSPSSTALSSIAAESGTVVSQPEALHLPSSAIAKVKRNQLLLQVTLDLLMWGAVCGKHLLSSTNQASSRGP